MKTKKKVLNLAATVVAAGLVTTGSAWANDDAAITEKGNPVTIAVLSNDSGTNNGNVHTLSIAGAAAANGSVAVNSTTPKTVTYTPNPSFVGTDSFQYKFKATTGNTPGFSDLFTVTVTVTPPSDSTAPTTSAIPSQDANANGWHKNDVEVTLSATDNAGGTGVASTSYSVNNGTAQAYTGPFTLSEGVHEVKFKSTDVAGNVETEKSFTVRIDKTDPTISASAGDYTAGSWTNQDVTVSFEASDDLSGLAGDNPEAQTFTIEGADQSASATVTDLAGNEATDTFSNINIDKTNPTLTWGDVVGSEGNNGWYVGAVTFNFTTDDNLSGVDQPTTNSVEISEDGRGQTTTVTVTDNAGNSAEFTSEVSVNIDTTDPETSLTVLGSKNPNGKMTGNVVVKLEATDATSGVAATYYRIDGKEARLYISSFTVAGPGAHTVEFYSVDNAGNEEIVQTEIITIDKPNNKK